MPMEDSYRDHADTYADFSEENPVNACYDRPAILRLAGDVNGLRVLELGCAAGYLTERLAEGGADVLALDREPAFVTHARERLGTRAQVEVADLDRPLDLVDTASIDLVVASLVLHYVEDWAPLLAELKRALRPSGRIVFSVHHPITGWNLSDRTDYHRVELITEAWRWNGVPVTAQMYRRSFSSIFAALRDAGFGVDLVDEPKPVNLPDITSDAMRAALMSAPVFLFVSATLRSSPN